MDLYRTLRVSLYLLAGTGALAISIAEGSWFYLVLIATLGITAYIFIDFGRIKPLTAELTAALTLVLLLLTLRHLRNDEHWQALFPGAVAHFLCAWQGLLFFSIYSGPVLLTFCGSTLAVVVMSGVVQSGPSLLVRVVCFVAVAVWTLYVHALWRARQEFSGRASMLLAGSEKSRGEDSKDDGRRLPQSAVKGTLWLVAGMSAACLALGTLLFFSTPRIDGVMAWFEKRGGGSSTTPGPFELGRGTGAGAISGVNNTVRLDQFERIGIDHRVALTATFSKPVLEIAGPERVLLLKCGNLSEYSSGQFLQDTDWETQEAKPGESVIVAPRDASLDGPVYSGEEVRMDVEAGTLQSKAIFTGGPILHVGVKKLESNREGVLRAVTDKAFLDKYTLRFSVPLAPDKIPFRYRAEHRDLRRYVLRRDINSPADREALQSLARRITASAANDRAKAYAIMNWLRSNCSYTLDFSNIHPTGDPIAHFLLSHDRSQRRGHCGIFAAAFVVLSRMNNMPARLCTGLAVRLDQTDPAALSVIARNSDAHAWAEIYFKNLGWIAFDPTPPVTEAERTVASAAANRNSAALASGNQAQSPDASEENAPADPKAGLVDNYWKTVMEYNWREQRKLYERIGGARTGSGSFFTGRGFGGILGAIVIWVGIAVAMFYMVQLFVKRGRRKKIAGIGSGGRGRAAVAFYNDLLHALSRRGFTRKPGQTPREFAEYVITRGGQAYLPAREITLIFEAVRYGQSEPAQDEFNKLQEALDRIREMTF